MIDRAVIYGANRVAKDFLYIFNDLEVLYFVDDIDTETTFLDKPLKKIDKELKEKKNNIIICDFEKDYKDEKLRSLGYKRGLDYYWEEDFFEELDEYRIDDNKSIAVWGTGNIASTVFNDYEFEADIYIDSNKKEGDVFKGKKVFSPSEINEWKSLFVIIAIANDDEIVKEMQKYGLSEYDDYIGYRKFISRPSFLLRRTIFDRSYYDLECKTMLNHLEVLRNGNTRCCCTTFVKPDLDNILDKNIHELWHSNIHKVMCLSTENHTYSFCDKKMCPLFVNKRQEDSVAENNYEKESNFPKVLALGYDATCNLACITCRKDIYHHNEKDKQLAKKITEVVNREYLDHCDFLILAGNGEAFLSPEYRAVYESDNCNPQYIRLLCNGTLFNETNWNGLTKNKNSEIMLTVSIDAATKETYEKIRRFGNFDILKKNMEFASKLRNDGRLRYFRLNFVVQKENYQEMVPFVKWGEELNVDEIFFTKILNWGTYTKEEFKDISMMEEDGITPKPELKEVLDSDVMINSKIVDLGTIRYTHKRDETEKVMNYYMWELEKRGGEIFTKM